MEEIKKCKNCIYYTVIGHGCYGGEKAKCKYCERMLYPSSYACVRHYKERGEDDET